MTKRQLIEEIRQFNADASPQFLAQFDPGSLKQYLEHIKLAQAHRRRATSPWQRTALRLVS